MALAALVVLFSAVLSVIWTKADRAERTAETNKMLLTHIHRSLEKTASLTERLTCLEASVNVEIKNLSIAIKRLESAVLRLDSRR